MAFPDVLGLKRRDRFSGLWLVDGWLRESSKFRPSGLVAEVEGRSPVGLGVLV